MAAALRIEVVSWERDLDVLMARIGGCFHRWETRLNARAMVDGLLADLPRKNCWSIAEHAGHRGPGRLQHLALTTAGPLITLDGVHHRVYEAAPGPAHPHPIGLWIGGVGPRMLRLVGGLGDGWIPSATRIPPDGLGEANARIDHAARGAGRDPSEIRRLYNIPGGYGHTCAWAAELTDIAQRHGTSGFLLFTNDSDEIARFGGDVAPAVRDALR